MSQLPSAPSASASIDIAADPESVYALLTYLPTLAEVSEETASLKWKYGSSAVKPGAVFKGKNRNGWHRWSTTSTVTDAQPGKTFAFEVTSVAGLKVARWQYDIAADSKGGCTVTESTWDQRPGWFAKTAGIVTGVSDRETVNAANIKSTLDRLKARAEK